MALNGRQKRQLRALAHPLKPVVQIGQRGLTEGVVLQVEAALADHELIKVRVGGESPVDRKEAAALLTARTGCEAAGMIGRVLILYRPHPEHPRIRLDDDFAEATNEEPASIATDSEGTPARQAPLEEEPV